MGSWRGLGGWWRNEMNWIQNMNRCVGPASWDARKPKEPMMSKHQPSISSLQAQCDAFNAAHPIGTAVMLKKDFVPQPIKTTTRGPAQVLSGHTAVIWLEGVTGCYALDCVTPNV